MEKKPIGGNYFNFFFFLIPNGPCANTYLCYTSTQINSVAQNYSQCFFLRNQNEKAVALSLE